MLFRLIDIPGPDVPEAAGNAVEFGRKFGAFLGLIATAGIAYAGWRATPRARPSRLPRPHRRLRLRRSRRPTV